MDGRYWSPISRKERLHSTSQLLAPGRGDSSIYYYSRYNYGWRQWDRRSQLPMYNLSNPSECLRSLSGSSMKEEWGYNRTPYITVLLARFHLPVGWNDTRCSVFLGALLIQIGESD